MLTQTINEMNNTTQQLLPSSNPLLPTYEKEESLDMTARGKQIQKKKKARCNLPKHVTNILNDWLSNHLDNPYPTASEKKELIAKTNLSSIQLSNWFINVRRRKLFSQYYDLKDKPISHETSVEKEKTPESKDKQLEREYMHTKKIMSLKNILNDEETYKSNSSDGKNTRIPKTATAPIIIMEADEVKLEQKFNLQPFIKRKKLMDRLYDLKKMYYVNDGDATGEQH